jgi:LacI family repressor for deo operon, udp, cdd, tsx, nupC, and nupG
MSELNRHAIRVPQDVSVIGFDDIEMAAHFIPPLTTIRQPRALIGETAAEMLVGLIQSDAPLPDIRAGMTRRLPVELVPRGSTASPG